MKIGLAPASLIQHFQTGRVTTAQDMADTVAKLGYEGFEVPQRFLPATDDAAANAALRAHLEELGLYMDVGLTTLRGLADSVRVGTHGPVFDQVHALGSDRIKVVLEPCGDRFEKHWTPDSMPGRVARVTADLATVADAAEAADVRVVCENHIDYTNDELSNIFSAVTNPYVGVMFDTANQYALADHSLAAARSLTSRIHSLHLKDGYAIPAPEGVTLVWCVPGAGFVPLDGILGELSIDNDLHANLELITGGPWDVPFDSNGYWDALPYTRESRADVVALLTARASSVNRSDLLDYEIEQLTESLGVIRQLRDAHPSA